ncbi:hypothetical protein BgiMline_006520 [Biomphalaria glabrata]|nr:hypothetical protein BgiMline_004422 [Biomphalaria glabrata]
MDFLTGQLFVLFLLIFCKIKEIFAQELTMEIWKTLQCPPDTLKCTDGHCCKYGEAYCNSVTNTCEPVFPTGLQDRKVYCCESLESPNVTAITNERLTTACYYLFGKENFTLNNCVDKTKNDIVDCTQDNGISYSEIIAWTLVSVLFIGASCLVMVIFYMCKTRFLRHDEENKHIDCSSDTDLTKQGQINKEKQSLLDSPADSPTQLKENLIQRNKETDDGRSEEDDVEVNRDVPRDQESSESINREVTSDKACHIPMQSSNRHVLIGLVQQTFSPADQDGNTAISPSGALYSMQNERI